MKIKKHLRSLLVYLILVATYSGTNVFGGDTLLNTATGETSNYFSQYITVSPRAEQTEWHYRYVDDKLQKRLWSITYAKWLTEWEWC